MAKLGLVQLAALGPNSALFNVIFFIAFMAMAVVTTDQMAQANARQDIEGIGRGFFTSITLAVVVGLLCWGVIGLFPEQVLTAFQTNQEMMEAAKTYAVIRGIACPASLIMVTCQAAFRALLDLRCVVEGVVGSCESWDACELLRRTTPTLAQLGTPSPSPSTGPPSWWC